MVAGLAWWRSRVFSLVGELPTGVSVGFLATDKSERQTFNSQVLKITYIVGSPVELVVVVVVLFLVTIVLVLAVVVVVSVGLV